MVSNLVLAPQYEQGISFHSSTCQTGSRNDRWHTKFQLWCDEAVLLAFRKMLAFRRAVRALTVFFFRKILLPDALCRADWRTGE
ncbi:hypothetical protein OCH239_20175 [Roseivivax halodurans JCM 10272]|uniref:Uncharacterized protein n=2 Tax=Roseivivax halodurans TaxID=93683 RepID=X7E8G6_9RHOB|nr:hypothetical protein OCH239_20175 [Roseivivax halodurans JCM 10272]